MAEDTRIAEFSQARKQAETNNALKIRLEERLEAAKKNLKATVDEIVAMGYDPKTFESEVSAMDARVSNELEEFKVAVESQAKALQAIEAQL